MKGSTEAFPSSSMATPNMVKPLSAYFCWKPIIQGISTRKGSQQVTQKFTTTTFPFKLSSATSLPRRSLKVTAGSFARTLGAGEPELFERHPEKTGGAILAGRGRPENKLRL